MVLRAWLVITWGLVLQQGLTEVLVYKYGLAARDNSPAQVNVGKELGIKGQTTCSLACDSDAACQGFAHSAQEHQCLLIYVSFQTNFQVAVASPGYNTFWPVTYHPGGFTRLGNKAYKFFNTAMTYMNARLTCLSYYANIALPVSAQENQYLVSMNGNQIIWLLADATAVLFHFVNTDTGVAINYTNWAWGEPNDYGGVERCAVIYVNGYWNDMSCYNLYAFVCEVPLSQCDGVHADIRCLYIRV